MVGAGAVIGLGACPVIRPEWLLHGGEGIMRSMRRFAFGFALSTLGTAASVRGQAPGPLRLEQKIELPDVQGRIDHMSVDLKTGRLFMAALGNDTVEVIDLKAARRVHTIRGLAEPQGILFAPDANRLLVANAKDGSVRIFDGSSLRPLQTVHLGDEHEHVAFLADEVGGDDLRLTEARDRRQPESARSIELRELATDGLGGDRPFDEPDPSGRIDPVVAGLAR